MGSSTKTGKTNVRTGIGQPEAQDTLSTLQDLLGQVDTTQLSNAISGLVGTANTLGSTTEKDRLDVNLNNVRSIIDRQRAEILNRVAENSLKRGVSEGLGATQLATAEGALRGSLVTDALQRSFSESQDANKNAAAIIQTLAGQQQDFGGLLVALVEGLLGKGVAGQTQSFAAREGARAATEGAALGAIGGIVPG